MNRLYAALRLRLRWWQRRCIASINHDAIVEHVRSEGRLSLSYSFMVVLSCAIAILGLLLSSPAVVIGAMLISPLMAPIMSLGFSLCLLDVQQMRTALAGVLGGMATALAMSWFIVTLSPLTDTTPEIMARTQPNLFDLLVAIFSGMAAGYAVIQRKGETIVGVAIATALMPPLAVVGFGLATDSLAIAKGAFMLFMTNLLAISLSVTLMAKFYGFGSRNGRKRTLGQLLLIALVFAGLSLPLGVALKNIAYQTYVAKTARGVIKSYFGKGQSHISLFNLNFHRDNGVSIDTVVLTSEYRAKAQPDISAQLAEKIDGNFALYLDQVVVAHETIKAAEDKPASEKAVASVLQAPSPPPAAPVPVPVEAPLPPAPPNAKPRREEMLETLRQAVFLTVESINVDAEHKRASIYPKLDKSVALASLHPLEARLQQRYPDWKITVVPPFQALPPIYFGINSDTLDDSEAGKLDDFAWALKHWGIGRVEVVGYASTAGEFKRRRKRFDNSALAYNRAMRVAGVLKAAGIEAIPQAEYPSFRQREKEQRDGINRFHRVEIRFTPPESGEGS